MLFVNIMKAFIVRFVLLSHSLLAIWRVSNIAGDKFFWLLAIADVPFIIEGLITIIARKGMDYKWFCPCFFFYLGGTLPSIWFLELDRQQRYTNVEQGLHSSTVTNTDLSEIYPGVSIPVSLPPDTWVLLIEQFQLYFMIVCRWLLPRGKISRKELSQLLFVFIGMASDITEFFTLFDEEVVRQNLHLTIAILVIWSVSLLQFCFVLTVTKSSKKARVAMDPDSESSGKKKTKYELCVESEIWSILFTLCMQDAPYLVFRIYVIFVYNMMNHGIIFFTAKNVLVTMMLLYRFVVICGEKDDADDDEDQVNGEAEMTVSVVHPNVTSTDTIISKEDSFNHNVIKEENIPQCDYDCNHFQIICDKQKNFFLKLQSRYTKCVNFLRRFLNAAVPQSVERSPREWEAGVRYPAAPYQRH